MNRLALALLLVAALVVAGCPKPTPTETKTTAATPSTGPMTLTVWDWHAADPSKGVGLWLTNIDREFERANPKVKINHVAQSHTEYYEIFKAAAAAASPERGPDVVMLHQGSRILDNTPSLTPLTDYVTPDFRKKIVGWEVTCEGYDPNGTPWAVPIAVQGLVWYYNRTLLKQAGLDPNKPPTTWKDFLAACDAMKGVGKAGIAVGEKEGFWSDWFINSAYFQTMTPQDKVDLVAGKMKWTDPKIVAILERLKELSDRGCFQKGAMSTPLFPDAGEAFMRGEAAFFLGLISDVAHWKEFGEMMGPENLGIMTCPVFQEGPNSTKFPTGGAFAYAVTKWSPHPKEAFDYIAFVANDEHATTFLTDVGSFPANQTYDRALISDPNAKTIAGWLAENRTGPQMTDMAATEVGETLRRECQRVLTGQTTVQAALAAVRKTAEEVAARKRAGS
ncbi:MAG: extracellular solute-binding protein [Armatimonadetes bacterium]|nr:extracellular solute-binding protein [Armatimonadota bacterium]